MAKAKLIGINHVALEVGDIDEALAFYGAVFDFSLRGRDDSHAFLDMGDQFLALEKARPTARDQGRHFGLVVDDRSEVMALALAAGATPVEGARLDFLDPWGNRIQMVDYAEIQFTKADAVLRGMGVELAKTEGARAELAKKGML